MVSYILSGDHSVLINFIAQGKNEAVELFNDQAIGGSLTMTSVKIG